MQERTEEQRCPICGRGVFTDVVYEEPEAGGPEPRLSGDSYEVLVFSCGHRVKGARLEEADQDRMTVERRESEDATEPVDRDDVQPPNDPWVPTDEEER